MATYKKIANRSNLTREEWLEIRRRGIGGSDAGAIARMNSYSTPYTVWADKKGLSPDKEETEALRQGNDLEEYVAQRFVEQTGKKIRKCNYVLQSIEHPFMIADVDRMVIGENSILECKTTKNYDGYHFGGGEYPSYWYAQVQHYMAVLGADKTYIAVLEFGKGFYIIEVPRSEQDIIGLIQLEGAFWRNYIEGNEEPPTDSSKTCTALVNAAFTADEALPVVDLAMYGEELEKLEQINRTIAKLTDSKTAIENEVKQFMAAATVGETALYRITWKERTSTRVDTQALKANFPEVYAKASKQTTSRTFVFKKIN